MKRSKGLLSELGQLSGDPFGPPVHAVLAFQSGSAGRELIQVGLLEFLTFRHDGLALVVQDRAREYIEAVEFALEHLSQDILNLLDDLGRQVLHTGGQFLAFHETEQTHTHRIGVEVIPTGFVGFVDQAKSLTSHT